MKPSIIPATQSQTRTRPRLLDQLAKYVVIKKLAEIEKGLIQLIDGGEIHEFGSYDNYPLKAMITVRDPAFYSTVAFGGSVGSGESYFMEDWDCDNLTNLVRIFLINYEVLDKLDKGVSKFQGIMNKMLHWLNRNTREGSKRNISAHYDLGNELFEVMLDKSMMYSSAIYPDKSASLESAASYKLDQICKKLDLKADDHLLEIGTGWGGMAIFATKNYGCRVTTTTISQQQYDYARQRVIEAGLEDRITLLLEDYRDLQGSYNKLVSIEMIEAVGLNNLGQYFEKCSSLLSEDGLMCIQAITIADQRYEQAKNEVDFIQKYIFPGGSLPSVTALSEAITNHTNMRLFNLEDIGPHYARTLHDWRERFFQNESRIRKLGYNDAFIRLWEYYLCYCEGGFRERAIGTVQLLITKPGNRRPCWIA